MSPNKWNGFCSIRIDDFTLITDSFFSLFKFKPEEYADENMSLSCLLGNLHSKSNYVSGFNFIIIFGLLKKNIEHTFIY